MAGTGTSSVRSGTIREVTSGTTPATPAFKLHHSPLMMMAKSELYESKSLIAGGGRTGQTITNIAVSGKYEGPLVYGVMDDFLETLMQSTWATNVLKDGKALVTQTVENTIPQGAGGTSSYYRFKGVEATGGKLTLKSQSAAMLSLDLMGAGSDNAATAIIAGATYVSPTEFEPISSGLGVGTITGFTYDCIESLDIDLSFDKREAQPRIMSNDYCGITRGDFMPKITARMYLETAGLALYNAARATQTAFALTIPLGNTTLKKYSLVFPKCMFSSTELDLSGNSVMHTVEILPQYDTASAATVVLTRAVV